jgi:hypothetical protein
VSFSNRTGSVVFFLYNEKTVETNGRLIITGLSGYDGWKIYLGSDGCIDGGTAYLVGYESAAQSYGDDTPVDSDGEPRPVLAMVSGSQVTVNIYLQYSAPMVSFVNSGYSGDDKNVKFSLVAWPSDKPDVYILGTVTVDFTHGNGGVAALTISADNFSQ